MSLHPPSRAGLAFLLSCFTATTALAQGGIPDEFENLEVLPEDISKFELVEVMKGFAMGLGVRCETCHVGEAGQPLETFDFASDEKETKKTARLMMKMVRDINNETLAELEKPDAERVEVRCVTCHRGQQRPLLMADALKEARVEGGTAAMLAKYRELRDRYYGSHTYDFTPGTLTAFAQDLAQDGHFDAALELMALNVEFNPDDALLYYGIGEIHLMNGDREAAIQNMQKTLDMAPDSPWADFIRQQIEKLRQAQPDS